MIEYTLEEVIDAIEKFDSIKLEEMLKTISGRFSFKIINYIPFEIRHKVEFLRLFVQITSIPQISFHPTTIENCHIDKKTKCFGFRFCNLKNNEITKLAEVFWKPEDFVNEQKWINNINSAITQIKRILQNQIDENKKMISHLPQTEFTIKDFKN